MAQLGQLKAVRGKLTMSKHVFNAVAENKHMDLRALMGQQSDPNHQNEYGITPLMVAAKSGHELCLDVLLEFGADPNMTSVTGLTALYLASANGHQRCVDLLMVAGANSSFKDAAGE